MKIFFICLNQEANMWNPAADGEEIQLLKAYRIKFQKFAAHAHKDVLINEN